MTVSWSIHVSINDPVSFLFMAEYYSIAYMHHLFIHSSADGHLGCFHVMSFVNSAALNIGRHVPFGIMVFSGYMPSSRIAGSYGSSIFQGTLILISTVPVSIYIHTSREEGSLFSTPSPAFIICRFFYDGHSDWCEVIPHCSLYLHFSND